MMKSNAEKAWERLTLNHEMLCDREVSLKCKKCEYYYTYTSNGSNICGCLKEDIKNWTLYRISEG